MFHSLGTQSIRLKIRVISLNKITFQEQFLTVQLERSYRHVEPIQGDGVIYPFPLSLSFSGYSPQRLYVVYFDQRLGAGHAKRWSKQSFSAFLLQKTYIQQLYVLLLFLTRPRFLLGYLGTFELLKLPTLWWGTYLLK